jgi:SRSO17 transposase
MDSLAHPLVEGAQFFKDYQAAFTSRSDGSTWPRLERTWLHASRYFRGLLRPGSRKSITRLAAKTDDHQEQLERFIRDSPWEDDRVISHLRSRTPAAVQTRTAALVLDDFGIPKKGSYSVGVGRQWCGATGKIDNCQSVVNLTLVTSGQQQNADQVTWPMGMRLYLPKKWAGDDPSVYQNQEEEERYARLRQETGIPAEIGYLPKHVIGTELIEEAAPTVSHACIVADSGYGKLTPLRKRLRELTEPYVLEIESGRLHMIPEGTELLEPGPTPGPGPARQYPTIPGTVTPHTAEELAQRVDKKDWTEVEWAEGSKGTLSGLFARKRVQTVKNVHKRRIFDESGWLLVQKEQPAADDSPIKAWICWGLDDYTLDELVSWAHVRWTIEQFHNEVKEVLGADEFQGRTWKGFHHHLTVVMLAHAFIAEHRLRTGIDGNGLDTFKDVARRLVLEAAVQRLIDRHGFSRHKAREVAEDMLRGFSEWE